MYASVIYITIGSNNDLSDTWYQAIFWTIHGILSFTSLRKELSEI